MSTLGPTVQEGVHQVFSKEPNISLAYSQCVRGSQLLPFLEHPTLINFCTPTQGVHMFSKAYYQEISGDFQAKFQEISGDFQRKFQEISGDTT